MSLFLSPKGLGSYSILALRIKAVSKKIMFNSNFSFRTQRFYALNTLKSMSRSCYSPRHEKKILCAS